MGKITINDFIFGMLRLHRQQVGAHRNQSLRATGRTVETAEQFLTARLGSVMQIGPESLAGCLVPVFQNRAEARIIGAKIAGESLKETGATIAIQGRVTIQNFAGQSEARGFPLAREERLAEVRKAGGLLQGIARPCFQPQQATPAFSD